MKIIFWGTSEFAVPALKALITNGYELVAVVTTPDKPAGRNKIMAPRPVKVTAEQLGIPILQPEKLKDDSFFEEFKKLEPDFCVVAAYGKIIPDRYISMPKKGFLNIHPSLLPKYRGPTPVQSAILNGDTETGVTIMKIDSEMDHGPILASTKYQITNTKSFREIHDELAEMGAKMLIEVINNYNNIIPQEQDHSKATFCKIYTREDGQIDWSRSAQEICNRVRALNPEPGTWTRWKNRILNIREIRIMNQELGAEIKPGITCKKDSKILITTGSDTLELLKIQLEGKKETSAIEFSHGHSDFIDAQLK